MGTPERCCRGRASGPSGPCSGAGASRTPRRCAPGRGRRAEERRDVVLADREHVHAGFLGLLGYLHDRVDALGLTRGVAGDRVASDVADRENSELHSHASVQLYAFAWIYNSVPTAVFPGAAVARAPWFLAVITTSADLWAAPPRGPSAGTMYVLR